MASLQLARAAYIVLGIGVLLVTAGHISGAATGGARLDLPIVIAGIGLGLLVLAAGAWVTSPGRLRGGTAWAGIVAGVGGFLYAFWIAVTSAGMDAVAFVGVPTALVLVAGGRLAWARWARVP